MKRVVSACLLAGVVACDQGSTPPATPALRALSPDGTRFQAPAYSPDGSRIAYWTSVDEGWRLWSANADMSNPVKLSPFVTAFGAQPALWSPDGSQLATYSAEFGTADVVVVPSSGGASKRVTNSAGLEIPLGWYPDGDRISYYGTTESSVSSFVASVRTATSIRAIPDEKRPNAAVVSPDGRHIAYFVGEGTNTHIFVADSSGHNPRRLTTEGFELFSFPIAPWSPDSKQLVYESRRTGTSDLWVVSIDSGKPRQLTRDIRNDYAAAWSPDGKWVAFISDRGRQTDVWTVSVATGEERRVTDSPDIEVPPLTWRGKASELTFVTTSYKSGVWAVNVADGQERRLTPDSVKAGFFNVSPDGSQVDYVIDRGGGSHELAVVPFAGGASRTLVSGGGNVADAYWSPDGRKIAFSSDRGGTPDIWVVDAAGGTPRQLLNWPGTDGNPVWSGDGKSILFFSDRETRLADIWRVSPDGGEPTRVTNSGALQVFLTWPGVSGFAAAVVQPNGRIALARGTDDGEVRTLWTESNVTSFLWSPTGDSLAAMVEQRDGKDLGMLLSARTGKGRVVLKPNETIGPISKDGKWMIYATPSGGESDLAIMNLATGDTKRITNTPETESGAEWTPDGKAIVFRRTQSIDRLMTVDLKAIIR